MKRVHFFIASVLLCVSLFGVSRRPVHASPPPYVHKNNIALRLEWEENYGYCGETTFICAGLFFGQYCSQYTARYIATNGAPQYLKSSQLVLGRNEETAAKAMHLAYEQWPYEKNSSPPQGSTDEFFIWIKQHVCKNHPVLIGLFDNQYILNNDPNPYDGDTEYDHIVPVLGVGSFTTPIDDGKYQGTDQIYFSDNGLYTPDPDDVPVYLFSSSFDALRLNRQQANAPTGPVYSLLCDPDHYGIAITGIEDEDNVTMRVRLETSVNCEIPEILDGAGMKNPPAGSNQPPTPKPVVLTVHVDNLEPSTTYHLYLYDDFNKVPSKGFNASAANAKQKFVINYTDPAGGTYTMTYQIMSNEIAAFRAVPESAP